ncbi:hypothetical protein IJ750_01505 [bacterium]|nr:hypothetical protein [bacterium]
MKRVAILYSNHTPTVDAVTAKLSSMGISSYQNPDIESEDFDLVILCNSKTKLNFKNAINIHHSLLPAYDSSEPVKDAILGGAKVTGLTVFYTNPYKIITQYPIFIRNDRHFDEIEQELNLIEQTIYPLVIEKILNNEPFEIQELINRKSNCSNNCEQCPNCGGSCSAKS